MAWFSPSIFELLTLTPTGRGREVPTAGLDDVAVDATELDEELDQVEVGAGVEVVEGAGVVEGAADVVGGGDHVDVGGGGGVEVEEGGGGAAELEEGAPPPEPNDHSP